MENTAPPNKVFSEQHPETARKVSFSRKIGSFCLFLVQTARHSFVENNRLPSFQGASDD
jgi:hypothetical protein